MTRPFINEPRPALPEPDVIQHSEFSNRNDSRSGEISAVSIFNIMLRYRVMIVALTLLGGFWAGFKSVTSGKGYTAEAVFMPKGARGQSQLSGLAAQFGVNIGTADAASSPQMYTDLMEMNTILWPVAEKEYRIRTDSGVITGNLVKIFHIKRDRPVVMKKKTVESLQRAVKGTVAPKTGVINLSVTTGNPELSLQIAQNVLAQLNIYNMSKRQEQAAAERAFAERQVGEKRAELRQAESELENFLESNRQYRQSPQLDLEYNRLQRQVGMRNQIYTSLLSAYETARIEEVKDLPVINVIEPPEMPIGPNPRGGARKTAIGMIVGLFLACLIAFARDRMARNREAQTDDFLEYSQLKREAIGDLTHPWRPISRAISSRRSS
jgi:uncharacterized protein involved in exopolysaccharide biosynthesis